MAQHALLSPSASHRWLNCTAAPSLEMHEPDETSVYAEEGTLAHAICEAKLLELKGAVADAEAYYKKQEGHAWAEHPLYKAEMEETSDYYRDVVAQKLVNARERSANVELLVEVTLDFSKWIPDGFGTADAIIISDGRIDVIDYKHGQGVKVDAFQNPQMMIYACGAVEEFDLEYGIHHVTMTIVQPRKDNTSTWEIETTNLFTWATEVLVPKAQEAFNGTLGCETTTRVGEWCRFCKVKHSCRERANVATKLLGHGDPRLLRGEEVAELLPLANSVKDWCSDLETHATALLLGGQPVNGYKLVEGRSTRKIVNVPGIIKRLVEAGVDENTLYKPREIIALGELERLVGKARFADLSEGFIEKPKGKPTLALATDKRAEYSSIEDDFSHIINS